MGLPASSNPGEMSPSAALGGMSLCPGNDPPCSEEGRRVHLPCAPASASPEQLCPPPSPKILSPELGGCLKWPKCSRGIGFSWCLKAAAARRAGLGFGKEKVFFQGWTKGWGFLSLHKPYLVFYHLENK